MIGSKYSLFKHFDYFNIEDFLEEKTKLNHVAADSCDLCELQDKVNNTLNLSINTRRIYFCTQNGTLLELTEVVPIR